MGTRRIAAVGLSKIPWRPLRCAAAVQLFSAALALAQPDSGTGTISGAVLGPDGALLPGVVVSVTRENRVVTQVVSDDQGGFRVSTLEPGRYELRADLPGFHSATAAVDVAASRATVADLTLALESLKESIVVVGTLPHDSIEAPRIAESGARDVGEMLTTMPGVSKVRRGAIASDIVLRGYQGDNVTVLIDGIRLNGACPNNMDPVAFHVDFAEVDRIEIGKGPFDVKNQGALGGVVNIVTKRPARGFHAAPQFAFGSFGYVNPSGTLSFGSDQFAVLGGYSFRRSDAYRDGSGRSFLAEANYRTAATDLPAFDVTTGWGRIDLQPAATHNVQLTFTRQHAGVVLYPYLQMDGGYDNATRMKAGWDIGHPSGAVEALRTEAFVTRVAHWMTDEHRLSSVTAAAVGYSMATMARSESIGFRSEATLSGSVTAGVEAYRRDWSAETRLATMAYRPQYSIPDTRLLSVGVFGEYSRPLRDSVTVDLGARLDRVDASADSNKAGVILYRAYHGVSATSARDVYPTAKARVSWRIVPQLVLSGGGGRTARVADPQERYFALARMASDWVGDPSLRPTTNTGVDAAINWRHPRLYLSATVHRDALGDFITVYQAKRIADVPGVVNHDARSYANVDATMSGAEAEGIFSVTDRLFVAADLSGVRGRQTPVPAAGIRSVNLAEIPPIRSRLAVRYDVHAGDRGLFGEAEVVHSAGQTHVNQDVRETASPGFSIVNLRMGGTYRKVRFTVGVGNLTNRAYLEHLSYQRDPFRSGIKVYEPGRNLYGNAVVAF